jgi:hypothetical protein
LCRSVSWFPALLLWSVAHRDRTVAIRAHRYSAGSGCYRCFFRWLVRADGSDCARRVRWSLAVPRRGRASLRASEVPDHGVSRYHRAHSLFGTSVDTSNPCFGSASRGLAEFDAFYRSGRWSLAAQAVPRPLFTFAADLGAVMGPVPSGITGIADGLWYRMEKAALDRGRTVSHDWRCISSCLTA